MDHGLARITIRFNSKKLSDFLPLIICKNTIKSLDFLVPQQLYIQLRLFFYETY